MHPTPERRVVDSPGAAAEGTSPQERALLRRQAEVLDLVHDAVLVRDLRDGTLRTWNHGATALYGWTRAEAVGQAFHTLVPTQLPRAHEEIEAELLRTGHWAGEVVQTHRDGNQLQVSSRWALQADEHGDPLVLEVNAPTLGHPQMEAPGAATVASQEPTPLPPQLAWLETGVQELPVGVIVAEAPSGRLLLGNQQVERIWRHPFLAAARVADYSQYQGLHADGRPYRPDEWPLARSMTTGEAVTAETIRFLRGDGSRGTLRVSSAPIRDAWGDIIAGVAVFDDITEQELMGQTLRQQAALQAVTAALSSALTPEDVADVIIAQGLAALDADMGAIVVLSEDASTLRTLRLVGYPAEAAERWGEFSVNSAVLLADAVRAKTVLTLHSAQERRARYPHLPQRTGALAAIPLVVGDRAVGAIGLDFPTERRFGPEDLAFMRAVADRCAQALDRARLFDVEQRARVQAEAAVAQLQTLQAVTDAALVHRTRDGLLLQVLERLTSVLAVDNAAVLLFSEDHASLVLHLARGPEEQVIGQVRIPLGQGFAGQIAATRQPLVVDDLTQGEWDLVNPILREHVRSLLGVPLLVEDRVLGVLRVGSARPRRFTADDVRFVQLVADRVARALEWARADEGLQQQATLLGLAPTAVIVRDLDSAVIFWNQAAEQTYGWKAEEACGQITHSLLRTRFPESREAVDAALRELGTWEGELEHTRRDGTRIVVASRQALQRDAQGRPVAILELNADITERKRLEQERQQLLAAEQLARTNAERAIQVRDEVLRAVSHDLKQPLTSIKLQAELLDEWAAQHQVGEADRLRKGLHRINTAAARMRTWIEDLVDVVRLETGQELALHLAAMDLVRLVEDTVADHQHAAPRHALRLHMAQPAITCPVDAARLRRVLDNLIGNAIKYSPAGGEVDVTLRVDSGPAGAWAVLSVRDQGIGIPAADQAHLFEPFRRARNVHGIAGSGIGLAGARQIVRQHGGQLSLTSQEGVGTTVWIRLPLAAPPAEAMARPG